MMHGKYFWHCLFHIYCTFIGQYTFMPMTIEGVQKLFSGEFYILMAWVTLHTQEANFNKRQLKCGLKFLGQSQNARRLSLPVSAAHDAQ